MEHKARPEIHAEGLSIKTGIGPGPGQKAMRRCELPGTAGFCADYESSENPIPEIYSSPGTNTLTDAGLAKLTILKKT